MGVAPPDGLDRDAGVLAGRAPVEKASRAGSGGHTPQQRALPVTPRRAGKRDLGRPVAAGHPAQRSADRRRGQGAAGRACCSHRPCGRYRQSARVECCAGRRRPRARRGGRSSTQGPLRTRFASSPATSTSRTRLSRATRTVDRASITSWNSCYAGGNADRELARRAACREKDVCSRIMRRSSGSSGWHRREQASAQVPSLTTIMNRTIQRSTSSIRE